MILANSAKCLSPKGNAVADLKVREALKYKLDAQASVSRHVCEFTRLRVELVFWRKNIRYGVAQRGQTFSGESI